MSIPSFTDMLGREVHIPLPPSRIISLVPSQTELLADLGLEGEVAGITRFCIHPERWFRSKIRVGGTKKIHTDRIRAIDPDLIIANKEENTEEIVRELSAFFPVWVSDVHNVTEGLEMIRQIGMITRKEHEADALASRISAAFSGLIPDKNARRVVYLIWKEPWMAAGGNTFINDMIRRAGWINLAEGMTRYPTVTAEWLEQQQPDLILLSSEPYPFSEKHAEALRSRLKYTQVELTDGEMFSWYGSRMLPAAGYIAGFIRNLQEPSY